MILFIIKIKNVMLERLKLQILQIKTDLRSYLKILLEA